MLCEISSAEPSITIVKYKVLVLKETELLVIQVFEIHFHLSDVLLLQRHTRRQDNPLDAPGQLTGGRF